MQLLHLLKAIVYVLLYEPVFLGINCVRGYETEVPR